MLRQAGNAFIGLAHASAAFESEWLGDDADGERTTFLGNLCHHWCRSGAGAATHARCDEHQIRALQCLLKISADSSAAF